MASLEQEVVVAMASLEQEAVVAAAVVENVTPQQQGGGCGGAGGGGDTVSAWRNVDIAWLKAKEASIRRYEAANWLRRYVGVVCAKDLAEEPSEDEFLVGLRNGIILCTALNKIQPGAVPKVVEVPSDSTAPADATALCAFQYFENVRNFLTGLQGLGLPTFEASDLQKGGQGVRVVDCVLALKSFCDAKQVGKQSSFKFGGIVKPLSGKYATRKNNEPSVKAMIRSHSAELLRDGVSLEQIGLDFSPELTETTAPDSIRMLVQTVLSDKKPEEIQSVVESLLSKVINELEHRIASQSELVYSLLLPATQFLLHLVLTKPTICTVGIIETMEQVKETMDTNGCNSVLRMESPCNTNDSKSLSRVDPPQVELTSCSDLEKNELVYSLHLPAAQFLLHLVLTKPTICTVGIIETMEQVKETMDTNGCNSVLRMESPCNTNDSKSLSRVDPPQVELTSCSDLEKATENIKMDEVDENALSLTEDVSTLVHAPLSNDNVNKNMPKPVRNFDREEKQIQDLKSNMSTVKCCMEQLKLLYSEDLKKLGNQLRIVSHAASGYRKFVQENRKLYNQIQDLTGIFFPSYIACLRAALARKDGGQESIRSTQSSPDIYRMRTGNGLPALRHPIVDGSIENDSALGDFAEHSPFGSSNSLPELGPDGTQDLAFYQRSSPEQQWSWSGSVATEDSDDFEVATNCSSDLDCVRPSSAPKASGLTNGGGSAARKSQLKGAKSSDIRGGNPAKKSSPLQKKLSAPSPTVTKKSGTEGKKTPNGKTGAKK
ncbi:P-loop nucleoside triphosphate hydrolase superfamily protein with CH (Calponin Homology) domain [Zea mays]|uniref:p-loop nucleoside triphosphate hydrolase superfamily protein with CH (Calponin Homology) domain n=1 Tax=Zea mays TaxID=4577 RepID=A0A1D6PNF4_MAIZE|nr:P-loop nucleoside triphosphate hydrolase superfamily protein with CH (Calponin Homology) domain [Zea mays]